MSENTIADIIILLTVLANIYYARITHKRNETKQEVIKDEVVDVKTKVENGLTKGE